MASLPPWGTDRDMPAKPPPSNHNSSSGKPYWTSDNPHDFDPVVRLRRDQMAQRPINKVDDIDGAKVKQLHPVNTSRPSTNLLVDDIEGTKPWASGQFHTKRATNPLVPEYKLPSHTVKPPTPPPPGRPILNVDDIDGTHSKSRYTGHTRNHMDYSDVDGSSPGWRRRKDLSKSGRDYMNVGDITKKQQKSSRVTNPLDPKYDLGDNYNGTTLPNIFPPSKGTGGRK